MSTAAAFMQQLKQEVLTHPFLTHPFLKQLAAKPLTRAQGKQFALLYYPHILRTRLYQANALGVTPDENLQFVLAEILYDEYGNGNLKKSHMEIYRNFMRAVGVTEVEVVNPYIMPELQGYIDTMMRISQSTHWLAAVAAVGIAGEWPIPLYYQSLLNALRTIPDITDNDLQLFIEHIDLDIEHSGMVEQALMAHASDVEAQKQIRHGVMLNLNARLVLLNGLQREMFI